MFEIDHDLRPIDEPSYTFIDALPRKHAIIENEKNRKYFEQYCSILSEKYALFEDFAESSTELSNCGRYLEVIEVSIKKRLDLFKDYAGSLRNHFCLQADVAWIELRKEKAFRQLFTT